jgi:hypothetical protein
MKKIALIFLFVILLFVYNITQASAGCNIVWSSGSIPTQETSRTQQAAYEAYMSILPANIICKAEQPNWSGSCYSVYIEGLGIDCWNDVCVSGVWDFGWYVWGGGTGCAIHPEQCYSSHSGTWDVICDGSTTTTTQQTTTTTIPQSTSTTTVPTSLIDLSSFTATPKLNKVILQWSTVAEIDNAGFNLYRAETEDGEYIKINTSLISAKGSSTQGASYEYIDNGLQNRKTYYYKLEDIDLNGTSTAHGPVSATPRWLLGIFSIFRK